MWIAEIATTSGTPFYTVLRHQDRKAALNALANYLHTLGHRQDVKQRGQAALYTAAGDLFAAARSSGASSMPVLELARRVYRVRQDTLEEQ